MPTVEFELKNQQPRPSHQTAQQLGPAQTQFKLLINVTYNNFGCDFCAQFQYNISLITGWNKSYFGVLCMCNFPAGHLNHLKSKRILPMTSMLTSEQAGFGSTSSCAFPFKIHRSILPAKQPSQLHLARTLM
jgi:hypothetical protein